MTDLASRLSDRSRPVFLLGDVPPGEGTPPGKCQSICDKFVSRSRALASDGFIVYDIQDEPGRSDMKRPFPFRRLMDSGAYGALLARSSGKECLVYKCVADPNFQEWLATATLTYGHTALNLVGRASSEATYQGPTLPEAMSLVANHSKQGNVGVNAGVGFGCVCIAERHTVEAARLRGKEYPTEHLNMLRKSRAGAQWFVSQAIYDTEPTIRLLRDYAAVCRQHNVTPSRVVLTFAPASRKKTMDFLRWLGVRVPNDVESTVLTSTDPVETNLSLLCKSLGEIIQETAGIGVPLGISCESVSIYKAEINACHELFRRLQQILLDAQGSPWKVQWIEVMSPPPPPQTNQDKDEPMDLVSSRRRHENEAFALLGSALLGGTLVGLSMLAGISLGRRQR